MSELRIPQTALVVLVGASGSGKSTFAAEHFAPTETLSADVFRGLVSNDEENQAATPAAFAALNFVAGKRLEAGLLTVVDATSVTPAARRTLVELARAHDVLPVAIVFDLERGLCLERNAARDTRQVPAEVVRRQSHQLRRSLRGLRREGFRTVHLLTSPAEVAEARIVRHPLLTDRSSDHGPFDVIGDVHGCFEELNELLADLGYAVAHDAQGRACDAVHPEGRRVIFLGDLVDRGPDSVGVLRLVMGMVAHGNALAVPGNHEEKLKKALSGRKVTLGHGLAETMLQLGEETEEFRQQVVEFIRGLVSHLVLDAGRLVVAHAGLKESYHGRASGRVRAFALYGQTTGESDEFGLPVRYPWAEDYRGEAMVLYGHTPVPMVEWINGTACLDTGCVFGGRLSALRYPDREVVSVPARAVHSDPIRPLEHPSGASLGHAVGPGVLSLSDVQGKRTISTAALGAVTISEEHAAGALQVMSRFAVDPRHLVYLPPTMSPPRSAAREGFLEHPDEAIADYRKQGITELICEEKHMGSRGVILLTRNPDRFSAPAGWRGTIHTRTGRPFFAEAVEAELLARIDSAVTAAGVWEELAADWLVLDAEILPWRLKAEDMIRDHFAAVAAAGLRSASASLAALDQAARSGLEVTALTERMGRRLRNVEAYQEAYRGYVGDVAEVAIAVFQVLAAGESVYDERDHLWHLGIADRLVAADPQLFASTRHLRVDAADEDSVTAAVQWWQDLTASGDEGMVVKPLANRVHGAKGLALPGIKVRGREYLRIIYGPDYCEPENLVRLRDRDTRRKRSLAIREYALGLEGLRRVAAGEPLHRCHEAVFGVLALESEPVDPRL